MYLTIILWNYVNIVCTHEAPMMGWWPLQSVSRLFHVRQTNSSRLLSCLSRKRINVLIYFIYMLLTVVQFEHQFIPFKLWKAVFQFLPQYQNHSCAVKLNILILAGNYKFLVTPDNSHIWISSYRLHRLSWAAQWKRLMWSVSFFRW